LPDWTYGNTISDYSHYFFPDLSPPIPQEGLTPIFSFAPQFYVYIYAFGRCFIKTNLHCIQCTFDHFPRNWNHDLGVMYLFSSEYKFSQETEVPNGGFCHDAIEEPFWVTQRTSKLTVFFLERRIFQSKEPILHYK